MKNKTLIFHITSISLLLLLSIQSSLAAAPTATSAVIKNSMQESVDIEIIGTDFSRFASSGTKDAGLADMALIIYNGTNPISAVIKNSTTITATFPIEMGTGKENGALNIITGTIEDKDGNSSGLISVTDQELTDNAEPLIVNRKTIDADSNGKVDGVLFIASERLNDQFEGLTVAVDGYSIEGVESGDFPGDNEFVVLLTENADECSDEDQAGCDTDAAPETQMTINSTLMDLAPSPMNIKSDASFVTANDGVSPLVIGAEFKKDSYLGITHNAVAITYSEVIKMSTDTNDQASNAQLGAMTTAKTLSGIGTWDGNSNMVVSSETGNRVTLNGNGMVLTVFINTDPESYFKSGAVAPTTPTFSPLSNDKVMDMAGNPVNEVITVVAENPSPWDITPPTIENTYSCDPDFDGDIGRVQVDFSEDILDASIKADNFALDNDNRKNNGEKAPDIFNTATAGCDGVGDDTDVNDDKIRFEFDEGIEGTEAAFLHHLESGARDHAGNLLEEGEGLGQENDRAVPVIADFRYEDGDGNGRIDKIMVTFSERVVAEKSMLSANDLTFNKTGDFEGAAFGSGETNGFIADGQNVYVELGEEAGVVDTFEGSHTIEIATQNNFALEDEAGNRNDDLTSQLQATFSDGAAPVIKTFGYQDTDGDDRIDHFVVVFSEKLAEESFFSAGNLTFTDVGDFIDAVFGPDLNDLVTGEVSWVDMPLGTGASVEDISEDSDTIAISTQNAFNLSDGVNTYSRKGDQPQATFENAVYLDLPIEDAVISAAEMEMAAPVSRFVETAPNFTDIVGHWAESFINEIAALGIVSGKQSNAFAPNDLMTRAELTKVAVLAFDIGVPEAVSDQPFIDVRPEIWYAPYIVAAKQNGIVQGDGQRFKPNDLITRAEVVKILIEAAKFNDVYEHYSANYVSKTGWTYAYFPDVPIGAWHARYVAYAKDNDIVGGYGDGTFRPGNPITRAEVSKIVIKVMDLLR